MEVKAEVEVEAAGTLTGPQRRAPVDEGVLDELDVVPHELEREDVLAALLDLLVRRHHHVEERALLVERRRRPLELVDLEVPAVERGIARLAALVLERRGVVAVEERLAEVGDAG